MNSVRIHPTALIDSKAKLGVNVEIGPFCIVGPDVELADSVQLLSHVSIGGRTRVGARTVVHPFASLGHPPQSLKYKGEPSELLIGSDCIIREHVTMNRGTEGGGMKTSVGEHGFFMVGVHIAHDCHIGHHVIMANNATLAGHVTVGDFVNIGGLSAVAQFVRIGSQTMISGMTGVTADVIPFAYVRLGTPGSLGGLNIIGLKRRGFSREDIHNLRTAYRLLFAEEGTMAERVEDVSQLYRDCGPVMEIVNFILSDSSRAIMQPKSEDAD
jgi:UDP-N-acetylglucosamine acyltransferase